MYKKPQQNNNQPQPISKMCKIRVFYRKAGKYDILETVAFGYRISVSSEITPYTDINDGNMYIQYDAYNASLMINDKGYPFLLIKQ